MGLQRKQRVPIQEGQQFDICGTMDEFRQLVGMYMFWKPLMDVYVSHVSQTKLGRNILLGEEILHQRVVICYV